MKSLSKIRVLIFINSFRAGGSERQALEVLKRLDRTRFEPIVACFQKEGPLLSELPPDIGKIHTFPLGGFLSWSAVKQGKDFRKVIRQAGIQIIQCFDFYSNLFAIPWGRMSGVPIILGARRDEASMRTLRQHRTELWIYKLATGIVANAESIKEQLVVRDKIISDKVWVIQNGLDLDRFDGHRQHYLNSGKEKIGPSIVVVANLRPEKGHFVLLEACSHLAERFSALKVFIVGNGSMKEAIAQRISELKLMHCVEMTGELKNVPAFLLKVADIAVLPSLKNEGFPNSVMEAMAAFLPVVATNTGGTSELVSDGLTGYLVPPADPVALQDRLEKLCVDPELRTKMGEAGRLRILERFTADRMVRRFESMYDILLKRIAV